MNRPANRFSDTELQAFYEEFREQVRRQDERYEELLEKIVENTKATESLAESTADLLEAWHTTMGAVKTAAVIGSAIKWLAGVGAAATALWYFLIHGGAPK